MPAKPERRPQILRAANKLFLSESYQAARMDDLAEKLKLNKATIYHHFPDGKQELLFEIIDGALSSVVEAIEEAADPDASPPDRIRGYLRAMVDFQQSHPEEVVVYFQQRPWLKKVFSRAQYKRCQEHEARARSLIEQAIVDGIDSGDFKEVDPSLATFGIMNVTASSYQWFRSRKVKDSKDIADFYAQVTFEGLMPRASAQRSTRKRRKAPTRKKPAAVS